MSAVSSPDLTDDLRQFIFEHVDSVGQLEVLLYMRERPEVAFNSETLSRELRTSLSSAASSLALLNRSSLLVEDPAAKGSYRYAPASPDLADVVSKLAAVYKVKPHKVFELIFSAAKRARQFADAFSLAKPNKPGDENG
jgi:hypothetical protein